MRIDLEKYWQLPRDQALQFQGALAKLGEAKRNPLVGYLPHRKQHAFHTSGAQIKAFFGGNQSGKTTAGLIDDVVQAVDADALPDRLRIYKRWSAPFYCRIVAPDFVQTMEKVVFPKLREWIPKDQLHGGSWDSAYKASERMLRFKNGSYFEFLTYEQDRDKHGGSTLHRVHYDEEPPQKIRKECRARLLKYNGDEIYTMTPSLEGTEGWTQDEIWDQREQVNPGSGIFAERVDMEDNPHLDPGSVAQFLATLSEVEREARKEGKFVHYAGMVYSALDTDIHTCPPIDRRDLEGLAPVIAIDPGTSWTGVVFGAFNNDNDLLVFDELILARQPDASGFCEIYPNGVQGEPASERIKAKLADWGLSLDDPDYERRPTFIIDPMARNRLGPAAEQWEAEYARFGIYCIHAQNPVEPGVAQVNRRLERKDADGNPNPALLIARNCRRVLWEMARYKIKDNADGKFEVWKRDDHCVDALRYLCMHRPWLTGLELPTKGFDNWKPFHSFSERVATRSESKPHWSLA